jgi:hypothetical protein
MHQHDKGTADHANDRDVPNEIEIELVIQCCVDRSSRVETEERVAVRLRAHDRFRRDIAGCSCPVLDYEWLAELLAEGLTQQAYEDVCAQRLRRRKGIAKRHPARCRHRQDV